MPQLISLVIPCCNEEGTVQPLYRALRAVMEEMGARYGVLFELLFVDDGSQDGTLALLRQVAREDRRVRWLSFSRNFGKEAAIYAGLRESRGDLVALLDADLQHPPRLLLRMYEGIANSGFDRVAARRRNREGESRVRSALARGFYRMARRLSHAPLVDGATDYCMMTRQVVDAILSMPEYNRFTKGIASWVGFSTDWIDYDNVERAAGESKWSLWKLGRYSLDGLLSFSTAPLAAASILGILMCLVAFVMGVVVLLKTLLLGDPVAGFPTLICAILLIGGIQLLCLGIMGQYVARIYLEVKGRPVYVVREEWPDGKAGPPPDGNQ